MTGRRPSIADLDALEADACREALAPLFEGAPRFLAELCRERPFVDEAHLFARARAIARTMPEPERIELLDAHPRLGAPPETVSRLSFGEQGYDRGVQSSVEREQTRVAAELERLNAAYEARFGFRYCVFVAGRTREALLPGFDAALRASREAEMARALDAVVDIAEDRYRRLSGDSSAPPGEPAEAPADT